MSPISEGNITDDGLSITYEDGTTEKINLSGNIQKDIVAAYDLLTPKRKGEARPSELELEKYIRDEGLSIGYATDDSGNRIIRQTPLTSSIGTRNISMPFKDVLITGTDSQGKAVTSTYSQFLEEELGENLYKGANILPADSEEQVQREFNRLINQSGFMPTELKEILNQQDKPYKVEVSGNTMTITIGDTVEVIKDVYNDSATGGVAGVAETIRGVVEKEVNRINRSDVSTVGGAIDYGSK